jgi:2-polyprenyl-6-methoxyphenol hydroxylase-like FAD-dependent oxidoreductase
VIEPGMQAATCLIQGWAPRMPADMRMYFASRPMIEFTIREFVTEDPNITLVEGASVDGLVSSEDLTGSVVSGVTVRHSGGQIDDLATDFVVDAGGRVSRAAVWMKAFGQNLEELTLDAKMTYAVVAPSLPPPATEYRALRRKKKRKRSVVGGYAALPSSRR